MKYSMNFQYQFYHDILFYFYHKFEITIRKNLLNFWYAKIKIFKGIYFYTIVQFRKIKKYFSNETNLFVGLPFLNWPKYLIFEKNYFQTWNFVFKWINLFETKVCCI